MSQNQIDKILDENIYYYDKNEFGHVILVMKDILKLKLKADNITKFINKVIVAIEESLKVSKKYHKTTGYVHVYLNECLLKDISISMFRRLNRELSDRFEDTVENIYLYSNTTFIKRIWGVVKMIVDPLTRKKIQIVIEGVPEVGQ